MCVIFFFVFGVSKARHRSRLFFVWQQIFLSFFILPDDDLRFLGIPSNNFYSLVWPLLAMNAKMFLKITQSGEEFRAIAAVECFTVVQTKMRSESVASVEGFFAAIFGTLKRLDLRMYAYVNLQRIWRQESFSTSILSTLEAIFTFWRKFNLLFHHHLLRSHLYVSSNAFVNFRRCCKSECTSRSCICIARTNPRFPA